MAVTSLLGKNTAVSFLSCYFDPLDFSQIDANLYLSDAHTVRQRGQSPAHHLLHEGCGVVAALPHHHTDHYLLHPVPGQPQEADRTAVQWDVPPSCHHSSRLSRLLREVPPAGRVGPVRGGVCHHRDQLQTELRQIKRMSRSVSSPTSNLSKILVTNERPFGALKILQDFRKINGHTTKIPKPQSQTFSIVLKFIFPFFSVL